MYSLLAEDVPSSERSFFYLIYKQFFGKKPTDPGQIKIFDEREVDFPIPEQKKKMGQPKKYDEPTRSISFKLPESAIEILKDLAFVEHTNSTQILLSLIERRAAEQKKVLDALKVIKEGERQ